MISVSCLIYFFLTHSFLFHLFLLLNQQHILIGSLFIYLPIFALFETSIENIKKALRR
ncbi:hypothetical protein C2W58_03291 [Bacillus pumilus]|nr:hypothetical protein C2W58_03291 [Bacillus pumilus]